VEQLYDSLIIATRADKAGQENYEQAQEQREQWMLEFMRIFGGNDDDEPTLFSGTIPQALMLMNGKLTADATSLENSRTLRAVVEAPFLGNEERLETLYLAALSRQPRSEEAEFLLKHVDSKTSEADRQEAFAEIFWGILNSPEFVLSR
ncbi:MAG: hypothetical protein ACREU7_13280, partial [Burkholderiales bacterium]